MRKPSPAMIVALLALFVALGRIGMAATGGNFILGKLNSADATTHLSAPIAGGNALSVSNLNTATGSSALRLDVASGHPPLRVNSGAGKAPNLSADKLDGIDSTALQRRVTGNCASGTAIRTISSSGSVVCQDSRTQRLVETSCANASAGFTTHAGPVLVFVAASGFTSGRLAVDKDLRRPRCDRDACAHDPEEELTRAWLDELWLSGSSRNRARAAVLSRRKDSRESPGRQMDAASS